MSPGDNVVCALRKIVSDTFSEMHTEEDHERVLREIRNQIADVLPPLNELLEAIEIEPIAVPTSTLSSQGPSEQGADEV